MRLPISSSTFMAYNWFNQISASHLSILNTLPPPQSASTGDIIASYFWYSLLNIALICLFKSRRFSIRSSYKLKLWTWIIYTVNCNFLHEFKHKHVYKCIFFEILTQTPSAEKFYLHKCNNFRLLYRHLKHIYGKRCKLKGYFNNDRYNTRFGWIRCKAICLRTDLKTERIVK